MRLSSTLLIFLMLCVSASLRLAFPSAVNAQVRPVNDYGALGLGQLLKRLNTTASVMMIGAHPDDEDSALLAYLARGESARTAYLSLTRGDGGQNIIGPELFESLGVIRTEELLQARRLDGAEQYFTRAYDYGFSKTLAEAKSKWPEDIIKCDVVRAIRLFRPLVVISRFSGTPADGHGQHQYSGYITPIAVKAAADPQACKDSGWPWQVLKFYVEQGFGADAAQPTLRINTGTYDPILGRSYFEIAMEGRSQHRSQGEGRIEFHGEQFSGLNFVGVDTSKAGKIFRGIDTSISGITSLSDNSEEAFGHLLDELSKKITQVTANPAIMESDKMIRDLAAVYKLANDAEWSTRNPESKRYAREIQQKAAAAIRIAVGTRIDALSDVETIVSGDSFMVSVKAFKIGNDGVVLSFGGAPADVRFGDISLTASPGWIAIKTDPPKQNNAAYNSREVAATGAVFNVKVDRSATLAQPYWLENPRDGDLFAWSKTDSQTLPFDPSQLIAHVRVNVNGTDITLDQPVQFRYADPLRGEIRRELNVVPALSVSVDQKLLIVPQSDKPQTRHLTISITSNAAKEVKGVAGLSINAATDWLFTANSSGFSLKNKGEKTNVAFNVTIPAKTRAGAYNIAANAMVGETVFNQTMNAIAYPHIQTHRFYTRAETKVVVLDLKAAPENVGYIMGSGDDVPESIRQMGLNVTMLEEKDLASGDLSKYDSIVVGIRASETRLDFVANKQRLLDYVKNGGNLIVQYQRPSSVLLNLFPFPVSMTDTQKTTAGTTARVVDENAKVTILKPDHPVFNFPNKIGDDDFKGWVQERNAYNLVTFDAQYTPLLEAHDAGEAENKGGLVVAQLGKGTYVYCSYSFFRQLPAGVPGAYRLFDNLLSLPKAAKK